MNKDNSALIEGAMRVSEGFTPEDKEKWFEITDKESFRAEASQLLKCSSLKKAKELLEDITNFENNFSGVKPDSHKFLYLQRFLHRVIDERDLKIDRYESLSKIFRRDVPVAANMDTAKAIDKLRKYILKEFPSEFSASGCHFEDGNIIDSIPSPLSDGDETGKKEEERVKSMVGFISDISDEFKRRILNAYFSVLVGVTPSEEVPFVKTRGGSIDYAAFRILVWLRNPNFNMKDFWHFLSGIQPQSLPERMTVDNGLPEVVRIFISKVGHPDKVDHLIITHRIVKGLWQNGSKFLNSYTLHNEDHAITLVKHSMEIIRRIDYFQLKQLDFYILFLACYLHDISMVIHPDLQLFSHAEEKNVSKMTPHLKAMRDSLKEWEKRTENLDDPRWFANFWKSFGVKMLNVFNDVYDFFEQKGRDSHPRESAQFIKGKRHDLFKYLEETIVEAVANAGEDHGKEIHHVYDIRSSARTDAVSAKYISIILRLADLMDVSNDRINYHLLNQNASHLSSKSKFHWISHLITDEIALIPNYHIDNVSHTVIKEDSTKEEQSDFFIKETLRFYLILNMKSLEPIQRDKGSCKKWCKAPYSSVNTPERYSDYEGITIQFTDKPCDETECPMVCRWMNEKHTWMFQELSRLQKYLDTVNFEPFRTEIEVNILFKDFSDINLKPSLFDDVRRYLKKEHYE